MIDTLTNRIKNIFSSFFKADEFTEKNVNEVAESIKEALLEADVNYSVAEEFIESIKKIVIGKDILKSVTIQQQFIKIVYDELIELMGKDETDIKIDKKLFVIMLCGLQGSGKTTQCSKLAYYLKKKSNKKVLLVACDLQRLAAVEQLKKNAKEIDVEVFSISEGKSPLKVAKEAMIRAKENNFDVVIIDTAGRLHIDKILMEELKKIKEITSPDEILFVANATTGQDAVNAAREFNTQIGITGSILTMMDSDARGGAAISIKKVSNKPLKFEGIGEKYSDFRLLNPTSMADRIIGRGDVINLVKKAEEEIGKEEQRKIEKKMKHATFNYEDYLYQMKLMKRMGSFSSLMKMMPGMSMFLKNVSSDNEKDLKKMHSIILSMTTDERIEKEKLVYSRRKRISNGSGNSLEEVNRLIKSFTDSKKVIKKMMKQFKNKGFKNIFNQMQEFYKGDVK